MAECVVALAGPDPAARYPAANSPLEYLGLLLEELEALAQFLVTLVEHSMPKAWIMFRSWH